MLNWLTTPSTGVIVAWRQVATRCLVPVGKDFRGLGGGAVKSSSNNIPCHPACYHFTYEIPEEVKFVQNECSVILSLYPDHD